MRALAQASLLTVVGGRKHGVESSWRVAPIARFVFYPNDIGSKALLLSCPGLAVRESLFPQKSRRALMKRPTSIVSSFINASDDEIGWRQLKYDLTIHEPI